MGVAIHGDVKKGNKEISSSGFYMFIANMKENNGMSYKYVTVQQVHVFKGKSVQ